MHQVWVESSWGKVMCGINHDPAYRIGGFVDLFKDRFTSFRIPGGVEGFHFHADLEFLQGIPEYQDLRSWSQILAEEF